MTNTLTRLSQVPALQKWASSFTLGDKFTVDLDGGLEISASATDADLVNGAKSLMSNRVNSSQVIRVIDRLLGQLIHHHSLMNKCSWAESIEALELCESDGRSMRSLSRLPRIVSRLDAEVLMLPDLTTKHFDQATAFQEPEDDEDRMLWKDRVKDILIEASLNPEERGGGWVSEKMKALQVEFGIDTGRPAAAKDILKNIAVCAYILRNWSDEDYENRGIERAVVADHFEEYMNSALQRNMISSPDNPVSFVLPWEAQTKTIETTTNEEPEIS